MSPLSLHLFDFSLEFSDARALCLGGPRVSKLMDGDGRTGGRRLNRTHFHTIQSDY